MSPTAAAMTAETSSTGRRPTRSASAAEIGVAAAMKTIATHIISSRLTRDMVAQHRAEGDVDPLVERHRSLEGRRLLERDPNVKSDRDQDRAGEERHPPGPVDERRFAESDQEREEEAGGDEEADRRAELGEHTEPGA